ncbi:hypothetical protein D3C77_404800 [compost metagenome]
MKQDVGSFQPAYLRFGAAKPWVSFKLTVLAGFLNSFGVDVGKVTRLLMNLIFI